MTLYELIFKGKKQNWENTFCFVFCLYALMNKDGWKTSSEVKKKKKKKVKTDLTERYVILDNTDKNLD